MRDALKLGDRAWFGVHGMETRNTVAVFAGVTGIVGGRRRGVFMLQTYPSVVARAVERNVLQLFGLEASQNGRYVDQCKKEAGHQLSCQPLHGACREGFKSLDD